MARVFLILYLTVQLAIQVNYAFFASEKGCREFNFMDIDADLKISYTPSKDTPPFDEGTEVRATCQGGKVAKHPLFSCKKVVIPGWSIASFKWQINDDPDPDHTNAVFFPYCMLEEGACDQLTVEIEGHDTALIRVAYFLPVDVGKMFAIDEFVSQKDKVPDKTTTDIGECPCEEHNKYPIPPTCNKGILE